MGRHVEAAMAPGYSIHNPVITAQHYMEHLHEVTAEQ